MSGRVALAALALALTGCVAVGPDYLRPAAIAPAQYKEVKGWKPAGPRDEAPKGAWWRAFHDGELDRLEATVAVSNQTLKADEANYRQALALISQARAGLFPTLNFDPNLTRSGPPAGDNLNAQIAGAWTLDVWGRVRRQVEQSGAAAEVSAADLANATLSAQSALALAYFQVRQADALYDLLGDTVGQYQRSLDIAQNQYNAGTTAKSDVITAQAQVLAAKASQINTEVARKQNEHAIAVLMGKPPSEVAVSHRGLAESAPHPPITLPSRLLERRPDIAAAERTMKEQNAAIGVAISAYYPDISLSGAFGYRGDPFIRQIAAANPVWSYALSIAQPLFDGGLTAAQVEAARASYEASVAAYRQTVLTAFQQVEDQLAAIRIYDREIKVQVEAVRIARQAVQIALNEYRAGTQAFTTVVTAEATALQDEESLLASKAARLSAAVALIVALGGGWDVADLPRLAQDGPPDAAAAP
ncbi:MAG: efflux transporter outer membrane subunit [Pseudomonadota bacterium]|nr:efflux transporter outer membrane subunit [Pseudomonadota bacterium]